MSKAVNVICQNALQKVGVEMDEGAALGSYAVPALADLNSVVTELNTQNLILQNVETVDVYASKKITFAVLPEEFHIVDKVTDLTTDMLNAYNLSDIVYVKEEDRYYYIDRIIAHDEGHIIAPVSSEDEKTLRELWPTVICKQVLPDRVEGFARLVGNRFLQLYPSNKMKMDSGTQQSLSTMYCCETESQKFTVLGIDYVIDYFVIHINSVLPSKYRITYLESMPEYNLYDTIYLSNKYIEVIEDGLCYKLCLRYKLLEFLPIFRDEYDAGKLAIKRINNKNRTINYDFVELGNIYGSYWDNLAGESL